MSMAIIFFFLHSPAPSGTTKEKLKRVDYIGTLLVLSFATLFLLAMNFGGQTFPWNSPAVIVPLVLTFVLIAVLCVVESRYAKEPIIPPRLFKDRSITAIMITNFWFGCTIFAIGYYLPVYMQVARGDSATQSGIRLIPMQLVVPFLSTTVGWLISRFGQWRPLWVLFQLQPVCSILKSTHMLHSMLFGMTVLCNGTGLLVVLDINSPWSQFYGITCFCGIGRCVGS